MTTEWALLGARQKRWLSVAVLFVILALGAALRLPNLRAFPAWYPDEGSNVAIAGALAQGESAYLAFGGSSFINSHTPLLYWEMAVLFRWLGEDILWARLLTVACGLLTLVVLYAVAAHMSGYTVALLAAGFYAVYPSAVVYHRLAFTYNQSALYYPVLIYALWRAAEGGRSRWIVLAALCAGAGVLTDISSIGLLMFLILALALVRPRALWWAAPLALSPFLLWVGGMTLAAGDIFLFDLNFALARSNASWLAQVARVFFYRTALESEVWLAVGGAGLLFLRGARQRWLAAGLFALALLVFVRNGATFGYAAYMLIPLFPLAAWGLGALLARGVPALVTVLEEAARSVLARWPLSPPWQARGARWFVSLILSVFLLSIPLSMLAEGVWLKYDLYLSRFAGVLVDPEQAGRVIEYVNRRTARDDVVLASPAVAWGLDARAADFQMAVAATGRATRAFPAGVPVAHFRFDPRLEKARYAVVDSLWREWAPALIPEMTQMVQEIESRWQLEMTAGDLAVYRNPQR